MRFKEGKEFMDLTVLLYLMCESKTSDDKIYGSGSSGDLVRWVEFSHFSDEET